MRSVEISSGGRGIVALISISGEECTQYREFAVSRLKCTFKISHQLVEICSSYVFGQLKKSGFEKNAFKVLSNVKVGHSDIFRALHLLLYHF